PPGHMMVLSGGSGAILASAPTPDGQPTYMSPLVLGAGDDRRVVFASGGETLPGKLWVAPLSALLDGDLGDARAIVEPTTTKGVIAVPTIADMNGDGT